MMTEPMLTPTTTAPPLRRGSMTPRPWLGFWRALRVSERGAALGSGQTPAWALAAARRRQRLLAFVLGCALLALVLLGAQDARVGLDLWPTLQALLFATLFGWIAAGFATALMGFRSLVHGDRHGLRAATLGAHGTLDPSARTAVIMPICNEDLGTVFGGVIAGHRRSP